MKRLRCGGIILMIGATTFATPLASEAQTWNPPIVIPGQAATLLTDGRWLLTGGQANGQTLSDISVWDATTQTSTRLPVALQQARAWHTATMLPNGSVVIVGGADGVGNMVETVEVFHPGIAAVDLLSDAHITPRMGHTATLLTDGRVLFGGGVSTGGSFLTAVELWDPISHAVASGPALSIPPRGHTATLQADGSVLLWGGTDVDGAALSSGELYDPVRNTLTEMTEAPATPATSDPVHVAASLPVDGAVDVSTDTVLAIRFSRPLRVDTLNTQTVFLNGPSGVEPIDVVPAEAGMLLFVTPEQPLQFAARYTLSLNGPADQGGELLPPSAIAFTTHAASMTGVTTSSSAQASSQSAGQVIAPDAPREAASDDEIWTPEPGGLRSTWRTGRGPSSNAMPPLTAQSGVTALSGRVLRLNDQPLAGVTLRIGTSATTTDDSGGFLLTGVAPGVYALVIDGRTASTAGRTYGIFEVNVELKAGTTVTLPYTIWMPRLDTAHAVKVPSDSPTETVVTTPLIPGLELRIPPQTVIRDIDGQPVTEVTITPVPLDRPPFPLPQGVEVPLYFTVQPGGAYLVNQAGTGARLIYPNAAQAPPGTPFEFWNYDADRKGWYIYGLGAVLPDGRQIVPNPGVTVYEFTGAMVVNPTNAPAKGPVPGSDPADGDPVNLGSGLFILSKTDLALPDVLPIALKRTYRQEDSQVRVFGKGSTHPYEMFLIGNTDTFSWVELILPDGGRVHYDRISPGTGFLAAVFQHTTTPTIFYNSTIAWNGNPWDFSGDWALTLKNGTVYVFGDTINGVMVAMQSIRDRYGNTVTLTRPDGPRGKLTKITSPNGRWIELTYDTSNRIRQATDNLGRVVSYTYDSSSRLSTVTDPNGGITTYTYDASDRMVTVTDARGITFLTNEYDPVSGNVTRQTQADGTTYQFVYTLDPNTGNIAQTDVTDPRGTGRRVTFNTDGFPLTDTRALGTALAQTTTYVRQAGSNFPTSITDALGRRTDYTYDAMGNPTSVTRLAGTGDTVATNFTYEPTFNQLASVTDPLGHTTTFSYDTAGNVTTMTDPLSHQQTFTYNPAGQPLTLTTPAGTTTLGYDAGNLISVTDPLGNTVNRFVDGGGRLALLSNPLGQQTRYDYDVLNRLLKITDAIAGQTQFSYDPNGNLRTVTDARGNSTSYLYDSMDRLATRTDPLTRAESYGYDANGSLTTFTDRKSQVTSSTFDVLNRRTQVTYADASTTSYTWDAGNRVTQITDSISGTMTRVYDGLDRLMQETTPQGTVSYAYDAAGRRTSLTVTGQAAVSYAYDNANRLTQITKGSAIVTLAYDAANRRTSLTLPNGVVMSSSYDTASRLTGLTYSSSGGTLGTLTYTYDAAGNRTVVGGTWTRANLPQAVASATYDAANRQLTFGSLVLGYDLNGNLTSDGTNSYTWDARNRLSALAGPTPASVQYDPLGRRTQKTINGVVTSFLYDRLNVVQEISATTTTILGGLGIDEYFTRTDSTGSMALLTDVVNSTVALTNANGAVATEYKYEPFGATSTRGTASNNPFGFTGRENDATGLYYYRARYYHPTLQRFVSEDPARFRGGDTNFYSYVYNSPHNFIDPTGQAWTVVGGAVGGAIAGAFAGGFTSAVATAVSGGSLGDIAQSAAIGAAVGGVIGGVVGASVGAGLPGGLGALADFGWGFDLGAANGEAAALASKVGALLGAFFDSLIKPPPADGAPNFGSPSPNPSSPGPNAPGGGSPGRGTGGRK